MPPPGAAAATTRAPPATFTGHESEEDRRRGHLRRRQHRSDRGAQSYGQDTLLPSIQLAIEDPGANTGICGWGYSCAYSNSVSWAAPNKPLPHEINPQLVFERLYGDGAHAGSSGRPAVPASDSILDAVTEQGWPAAVAAAGE